MQEINAGLYAGKSTYLLVINKHILTALLPEVHKMWIMRPP